MTLSLRKLRLRAVWLLVLPFFLLARPDPFLLVCGGVLAALGVGLRAWAAGFIHKERELSTSGPYAHTRNPLYVGSFLIGLGATIAGGRWTFVLLFGVFYLWVYGRTVRAEARLLEDRFGERYQEYARQVPLFLPRVVPYLPPGGAAAFSVDRWRRNREYEALAGVAAAFALLLAKMLWI